MEPQTIANSPWLDPKFLLTAAGLVVGLIMWFLKLEFKTNANATRQKEYEGEMDEQIREARAEQKELKKSFYAHASDTRIHHNEEMFKEFRSGIDRRFGGLENTLLDIGRKLDNLAGREGK